MYRAALTAAVVLAACGNPQPPPLPSEEDLIIAVLAEADADHSVLDPKAIGSRVTILDDVGGSDLDVTSRRVPSTERWRIVTREQLQVEADEHGQNVFFIFLGIQVNGPDATVRFGASGLAPTQMPDVGFSLGVCCCGASEQWDGSSGSWRFASRTHWCS